MMVLVYCDPIHGAKSAILWNCPIGSEWKYALRFQIVSVLLLDEYWSQTLPLVLSEVDDFELIPDLRRKYMLTWRFVNQWQLLISDSAPLEVIHG